MLIVVISDSHGNIDAIKKVRNINPNADMYLHLGDSELPKYLLDGFVSVKGNCDYFCDYPLNLTLKTKYGNIYLEHGNHYFPIDDNYILSKNCRIFLFGHTHKRYLKQISNCYIANPGSLTKPRDGNLGSYLIIKLEQNNVQFEFKQLED